MRWPKVPSGWRRRIICVVWVHVVLWSGGGKFCSLALEPLSSERLGNEPAMAELVERLGAPTFRERQDAMRQLSRWGIKSLPVLEQAAQSGDPEVRARALSILEKYFRTGNDELKNAAKEVLERLANTDSPAGRAAQLVLNPPPEPSVTDWQRRALALQLRQLGQIQVQQAIPIAPNGNVVVNRSATIQEANGKKVTIQQSGQRIKVSWTELPPNGPPVTKQAEAASLEELKTQHPQAYEVYRQYAPRFGFPLPK